jgi:SAM-dependent methyltransferase
MLAGFTGPCPVCGGSEFIETAVLWPELISAWQLSRDEVAYMNRQQGLCCAYCSNNLRAMGLAKAVLLTQSFSGTFNEFCLSRPHLVVLEINRAGNLTPFLEKLPFHRLVEYPQFDMLTLDINSESCDMVLHSDTLEHVTDATRGLSECRRVLRDGGQCVFTIPIIIDRLTRSRAGLPASYHGQEGVCDDAQTVHTEFGADMWKEVLRAGFASCEIYSLEYPAALAIIAKK